MKFLLIAFAIGAAGWTVSADLGYVSEVQQNYDQTVNDALVEQIKYELTASYVYQAYASFFGRADVALAGFQKFFAAASKEERDHAQTLIDYINQRGGVAQYESINLEKACDAMAANKDVTFSNSRTRPCICEMMWTQSDNECNLDEDKRQYGLQSMEDALALERFVNDKILSLHKTAGRNNDAHLTHVLEHVFLEEQVTSIRELAGYVTRLRSFKTNYALGEYMFDQKLQ